jgi:hypothetical protein
MSGISFFLKTYSAEIDIACLCCKSIAQFCKSDYDITVVLDNNEEKLSFTQRVSQNITGLRVLSASDLLIIARNGYIDQQCCKLLAFNYGQYDIVFHLDSDMVFYREFTLSDFAFNDKLLLPYREWPRYYVPGASFIYRVQQYSQNRFFSIRALENELLGFSEDIKQDLKISFIDNNVHSFALEVDHNEYGWSKRYPDLLWIIASRYTSNNPLDTMACHYAMYKDELSNLGDYIFKKSGCNISELAYNAKELPVFSEFQLIGNFILGNSSSQFFDHYMPISASVTIHNKFLRDKLPYIKYNAKDHPLETFNNILRGDYAKLPSKYDVFPLLQGRWG